MPDYLWRRGEGLVRKLALAPLLPLEAAYRLGTRAHRALYDLGLRRRVRLPTDVVSVGNLSVGGSGKTPLVAWLASALHDRGRKVAILSRGVGGARISDVNVVSDGERVLLGPHDVGDEPVWLAGATRGVPVLAGRNRAALGLRALALFGVDTLILDDGFQHHRLARDLDLVCLDAGLGLGNGHVLPRGPLRESRAALRRAHAFAWTRVDPADPDLPPGHDRLPRAPAQFRVPIEPTALRDLASGERVPATRLSGERVGLLAAIARPDRFEAVALELGAQVANRVLRPDHASYERADLEALDRGLRWLTTAKDAVKLPSDWARGREIWVLEESVVGDVATPLADFVHETLDAKEGRV